MIEFSDISDELLAAYIDGNTTQEESMLVSKAINQDSFLAEIVDIVNDASSLGNHPWDVCNGDFGFWEMGLPPVIKSEEPNSIVSITNLPGTPMGIIDNTDMSSLENFGQTDLSSLNDMDNLTSENNFDI